MEIGKEHAFMYSAKFLQKFVGTLHVYGWLKGLIVSETFALQSSLFARVRVFKSTRVIHLCSQLSVSDSTTR